MYEKTDNQANRNTDSQVNGLYKEHLRSLGFDEVGFAVVHPSVAHGKVGLTHQELRVYIVITSYRSKTSPYPYASDRTYAKEIGMELRNFKKAKQSLIKKGFLKEIDEVCHSKGVSTKKFEIYTLPPYGQICHEENGQINQGDGKYDHGVDGESNHGVGGQVDQGADGESNQPSKPLNKPPNKPVEEREGTNSHSLFSPDRKEGAYASLNKTETETETRNLADNSKAPSLAKSEVNPSAEETKENQADPGLVGSRADVIESNAGDGSPANGVTTPEQLTECIKSRCYMPDQGKDKHSYTRDMETISELAEKHIERFGNDLSLIDMAISKTKAKPGRKLPYSSDVRKTYNELIENLPQEETIDLSSYKNLQECLKDWVKSFNDKDDRDLEKLIQAEKLINDHPEIIKGVQYKKFFATDLLDELKRLYKVKMEELKKQLSLSEDGDINKAKEYCRANSIAFHDRLEREGYPEREGDYINKCLSKLESILSRPEMCIIYTELMVDMEPYPRAKHICTIIEEVERRIIKQNTEKKRPPIFKEEVLRESLEFKPIGDIKDAEEFCEEWEINTNPTNHDCEFYPEETIIKYKKKLSYSLKLQGAKLIYAYLLDTIRGHDRNIVRLVNIAQWEFRKILSEVRVGTRIQKTLIPDDIAKSIKEEFGAVKNAA